MKLSACGSCAVLIVAALTGCAGPPRAVPGQVLGYGTPGVESYVAPGDGRTLAELQARCQAVPAFGGPPPPQSLAAACDQLRRTEFNQPGNTVGRARR